MELTRVVPILRIFSLDKAKEFYVGFLGFTVDWEHRFEDVSPVYIQVSRGGIILHLSEHHGDATPGSAIRIEMTGLDEYHAELTAKKYSYMRPGIEEQPWGERSMTVIDPFRSKLIFCERDSSK